MPKGLNFDTVMSRMHEEARQAFIRGDEGDHFTIMLNVEMNFWRKSKCGLVASAIHIHDTLIKRRKQAEFIRGLAR